MKYLNILFLLISFLSFSQDKINIKKQLPLVVKHKVNYTDYFLRDIQFEQFASKKGKRTWAKNSKKNPVQFVTLTEYSKNIFLMAIWRKQSIDSVLVGNDLYVYKTTKIKRKF